MLVLDTLALPIDTLGTAETCCAARRRVTNDASEHTYYYSATKNADHHDALAYTAINGHLLIVKGQSHSSIGTITLWFAGGHAGGPQTGDPE
jgi:hypothetical protein